MKTLIIACLAITLMVSPACAGEWFAWDEKNTEYFWYTAGLLAVDLGQTLDIADNCAFYYDPNRHVITRDFTETNYFLDICPTRTEVKQYFGYATALIALTTWVLESDSEHDAKKGDELSHLFQKGTIALEFFAIGKNLYVGVGFGF